jgi:NAD(P)-dependent dehydrogenase (short-subunit alcohol dehydrogenase family)
MGILSGRTALVVGASAGGGYGIALRFAQEGANVVAAARRFDRLNRLAEDARTRGFSGRIVPAACDIDIETDLDSVVLRTVEEFGTVDILVCVAQGAGTRYSDVSETTLENALDFFRGGPGYTMLLMQKCLPYMKGQGYGRIVTTTSAGADSGTPNITAYSMAKAAIITLTRKAAVAWGQYGITVNSFMPLNSNDSDDSQIVRNPPKEFLDRIPVRYIGDPYLHLSPVIAFLVSEQAGYLTGQVIRIDGGLSAN